MDLCVYSDPSFLPPPNSLPSCMTLADFVITNGDETPAVSGTNTSALTATVGTVSPSASPYSEDSRNVVAGLQEEIKALKEELNAAKMGTTKK